MKRLQNLTLIATLLVLSANAHADERRVATLAPVGSPWMTILEKGAAAKMRGRCCGAYAISPCGTTRT